MTAKELVDLLNRIKDRSPDIFRHLIGMIQALGR